jgi:hypothetical protein
MRIAAFYSGQLRTFKQCWPTHRRLFDPCIAAGHDVRMFFLLTEYVADEFDGLGYTRLVSNFTEPDFSDADHKYTRRGPGVRGVAPNMKQLWSLKKSFECIPDVDSYDLCVRMRYDLEIIHPGAPLYLCSDQHLTVPCFCNYWGYNDRFYVAPPRIMRLCANRLDTVDEFYQGHHWHMESHLGWTVGQHNIPIARSSILFNLLRADGTRDGIYHEERWHDVPFQDTELCL